MAHPQTNGLAEVTNRSILDGLRRRVSAARSAWVDELSSILWSLQTTPKTATKESPEVVFPTPPMENYDETTLAEGMRVGLDLLEERRADAHLRDLFYK